LSQIVAFGWPFDDPPVLTVLYGMGVDESVRARLEDVLPGIEVHHVPYFEDHELRNARMGGHLTEELRARAPRLTDDQWAILERTTMAVAVDLPDGFLATAGPLRWVQTMSAGTNHLDAERLAAAGVVLTNGAGLVLATRRTAVRGASDPDVDKLYTRDELDVMLEQCDAVVPSAPATPETVGLFDRRRIETMRTGAVLCNVARGSLIDEDALVEALRSGHLGAAVLDATVHEPLPSDSPLWTAPNCYVSSHNASAGGGGYAGISWSGISNGSCAAMTSRTS
jgi:phosphoglycerate dehydrogenase-like enzyme